MSLAGNRTRGAEVHRANGPHTLRPPGDDTPMVVHLPKVVGQMGREVEKIFSGLYPDPADRFGKISGEHGRVDSGQHPERGPGGLDLVDQLCPGHIPATELRWTISNVTRRSKAGSDKMLQVPGEVQHQGPGAVDDSGWRVPELTLVRVGFDFAAERSEIAIHGRGNGWQQHPEIFPLA
jgi:hypothetical protein